MIRRSIALTTLVLLVGSVVASHAQEATTRGERHWAYLPIRRPPQPTVRNARWPRRAIDYFVLARLENAAMTPSAVADRYTLIKRLSYDLLGLPPHPAETEAFVKDSSPDAYARLVERLLASPAFGERWGRHWLDKARYADSDGYEKDKPRPDAWRYRDWVIRSINEDLPFDEFTRLQLAGDLVPEASDAARLATAFHRQTLTNTEGGTDQEQFRVEAIFDRVNTTATVWLGLTAGCAQCHDHKYDAISQREYYQLFAFFNNADETTVKVPVASVSEDQSDDAEPELMDVRVIAERTEKRRETHVFHRGDFLQPRESVTPAILEIFPPLEARGGGVPDRLDLAGWLFDRDNPLPARVAVNHVWTKLFGKGLVPTVNDFGVRGERPTHPALLDWLASEYRRLGWSRKALIREIVLSATYRQESRHREEYREEDPDNRLLYRQNRFRVEAEVVRDLALAVSGLLARRVGGPSVFPPMPPEIANLSYAGNFKWTTSAGANRYRRGLYTFFKRTAPHPNLTSFDAPDANTTCTARQTSNTPLQALTLLNNEVFTEAARALAKRLAKEGELGGAGERLIRAFRLCVTRAPSDTELNELRSLFQDAQAQFRRDPESALAVLGLEPESANAAIDAQEAVSGAAWLVVARVLLNLDEFLTRE